MIHVMESGLRKLRRWVSRSEWSLRFLKLPVLPEAEPGSERGLVMIQIDGLSRAQLERALRRGRMPFLRKLMRREGYHLHSVYSGIPSTTAAAQAELFYGVCCAVPAFAYRDRKANRSMKMITPECAAQVERELEAAGRGLFEGGSAYSNIYTGGAKEPHFCASALNPAEIFKRANPLAIFTILAWNLGSLLRLGALLVLEFVLSLYDSLRGAIARGEVRYELLFVFSRVLLVVGLRELVTVMASMDVTRGLPVVQVNYSGYDEQSHRRGPSSKFAHFSLRGIDNSIKRLWTAANRSSHRDYDIWIYSDHGQEGSVPFLKERGVTVEEAVAGVLRDRGMVPAGARLRRVHSAHHVGNRMEGYLLRRSGSTRAEAAAELAASARPEQVPGAPASVVAMGPIGHIYLEKTAEPGLREGVARRLVAAGIPMVLYPDGHGRAAAFTRAGRFSLPEDGGAVLGSRHPFPEECSRDLVRLCHHPHAGDFVICGWRPEGKPLTFAWENGAHGGPGFEETHAFGLFPGNAPLPHAPYFRYTQIREAALRVRGEVSPSLAYHRRAREAERTLRIMTYNVHGCGGMDGKVSIARIARVIAHYEPDIVALQESGGDAADGQARAVARELMATYHFTDDLSVEQDEYGNALLSVHPMRRIQASTLPTLPGRMIEKRGALRAAVDFHGTELQLINTHLGLFSLERIKQAEALLGPEWLGQCAGPVILLGDFNAFPSSPVYRSLTSRLVEAQEGAVGHKPLNTFFGRYPVYRIDHIFCSRDFRTLKVEVPRTHLTRLASDHLPIIAELELQLQAVGVPVASG